MFESESNFSSDSSSEAQASPIEALLAKTSAAFSEQQAHRAPPADAPAQPSSSGFDVLGLSRELVIAVRDSGYTTPTEVQKLAIPAALSGQDLRVSSSTGSGKTAAFVLPALQRILAARGDATRRAKGMSYGPRILVLAPTRELAMQVAKACQTYGKHMQGLRVATVVGGVPYPAQLKALRGPLDVLIATPGRLLDHLGTGAAVLSNLEVLVLDEADRMLDMGFIDDIQAIAAVTPAERQTMMFSATFAGHVGRLADNLTRNAQRIEVASHTDRHDNIEQRLYWFDHTGHKHDLLDHFLTERSVDQAVVFTATQHDADRLADRLAELGHAVAALHGGMPQGKRNRVLQALRTRQLRVLVATDVAARGIDVPTITHVINYGMPMKAEDYVHRIGRTGRAGRSGLALTLAGRDDQHMIRRIERFTTQRIPVATVPGMEPTKAAPPSGPGTKAPTRGKPMPGQRHGARREGGGRFDAPHSYGGERSSGRDYPRQGDDARGARPEGGGYAGGGQRFGASAGQRPEGAPRFEQRDGGSRPYAGARDGAPARREGGSFDERSRPAFQPRTAARGEGRPGPGGRPGGFGGKPSGGFGGKKPSGGPRRPRD